MLDQSEKLKIYGKCGHPKRISNYLTFLANSFKIIQLTEINISIIVILHFDAVFSVDRHTHTVCRINRHTHNSLTFSQRFID